VNGFRPPERHKISYLEDSRRWEQIDRRPGDIVISTPPKSGTTWMQGIVTALLWPNGDAPDAFSALSPWIDFRIPAIDELIVRIETQDHRRFLKTHTSATGYPVDVAGKNIVVYRDGRDALVSWSNHREKMRPEVVEMLNEAAAGDDVEPLPPVWNGDMDQLFDEWERDCSPTDHLAGWWPLRHEPYVCFVHYNDLSADLEGEMRRIADFLELEIPEEQWPSVVERCRIDAMRSEAHSAGLHELGFEGGASSFFHKGTNGRWEGVLTDAQLARYDAMVSELPADAAAWLEYGSLALGHRP
jgi:aryl sulfotransferase